MLKQRTTVYWHCARCGMKNQLREVLAEYEPATLYCDHCGEETWVDLRDLLDAQGKRWVTGREPPEQ